MLMLELKVSCDVVRRSSRQQRSIRFRLGFPWLSEQEVPTSTKCDSTLYLAIERRSDAADPIYLRTSTSARVQLINATPMTLLYLRTMKEQPATSRR
jgi:hypothetical protein